MPCWVSAPGLFLVLTYLCCRDQSESEGEVSEAASGDEEPKEMQGSKCAPLLLSCFQLLSLELPSSAVSQCWLSALHWNLAACCLLEAAQLRTHHQLAWLHRLLRTKMQ